ncbi:flagellar motor protein MotB [Acidicapsa ligni]|uniref:flagellar motor protein MotB n=1 Tax=Acidicapsa ligni TaxID=542300 RepID=UPI0021DFD1C6|nr:flagellar motor protein MotB [Acidicapsa ligni]
MRRTSSTSSTSHERWLVSYADFITLMFAFFVVLYASSKADQKKQQQVSLAIDSAFHSLGIFPDSARKKLDFRNVSAINPDKTVIPMNIVMGEDVLAPAEVKEHLQRVQQDLEKMLSNQIAQHTVSIQMGKDGLIISLKEAGFFASGSATPQSDTLPVLRKIAAALGKTSYDLRIEGHTDNVPIHTSEFDSNWELSSARATRLTRIFLTTGDLAPDRLSTAGYAEFHPVASNDTPAGRAENRRVDLVVRPRTKINLAMPEADSTKAMWKKITDH